MSATVPLPKTLERDPATDALSPFRNRKTFMRLEPDGSSPRVLIAPERDIAQLVLDLSADWTEPFGLLYVLVVPRGEAPPGRYERFPVTRDDVVVFVDRFREFLTQDARHHIWIVTPADRRQVIWNRHDLLVAYGDLDATISKLLMRGFREADVGALPAHVHHYHAEFDEHARTLHASFEWRRWPLQPSDSD